MYIEEGYLVFWGPFGKIVEVKTNTVSQNVYYLYIKGEKSVLKNK